MQSSSEQRGTAPLTVPLFQSKRLHISNIPFKMGPSDLAWLFSHFGPVTDADVICNVKGSKGYGFVTMARPEDAERAKRSLNLAVVNGRTVEVNYALPKNKFRICPSPALMREEQVLKTLSTRHTVVLPDGSLFQRQQPQAPPPPPTLPMQSLLVPPRIRPPPSLSLSHSSDPDPAWYRRLNDLMALDSMSTDDFPASPTKSASQTSHLSSQTLSSSSDSSQYRLFL